MVGDARNGRLTAAGPVALFGGGFRHVRTNRTGLRDSAELFLVPFLFGYRGVLRDDISAVRWRGRTSPPARRG
ncbi:MAG: hypothetical protein EBQ56_01380 [Proteobacteria bacterium]|nr:hypothetical protein [Pseudomonadota bacterium]NBT19860.1 hypothetical protein [Pseudomonadota bacterium]NBT25311.1 hypothetical protein [Actinomycetota bacterium]NBY46430.1 hypothetical protein [Pseudomonadota bacterium]